MQPLTALLVDTAGHFKHRKTFLLLSRIFHVKRRVKVVILFKLSREDVFFICQWEECFPLRSLDQSARLYIITFATFLKR